MSIPKDQYFSSVSRLESSGGTLGDFDIFDLENLKNAFDSAELPVLSNQDQIDGFLLGLEVEEGGPSNAWYVMERQKANQVYAEITQRLMAGQMEDEDEGETSTPQI